MEVNTEAVSDMKKRFFAALLSEDSKYNSVLLTKEKYNSIIEDVKRIKVSNKKESSRDYRIIQRYDVLTIEGCEKLIGPLSDSRGSVKMFVHAEELFDILYYTHVALGHSGRDKMFQELNTMYKNITQAQIKMFLGLCEPCQQKSAKKGSVAKPSISSNFNSRGYVDIIDYQSQPDGEFRFLLIYEDNPTKFVVLKPLTSKQPEEVANTLLDIFLLFGAPVILHYDNEREFCDKIIENITKLWPQLKMVNGKPNQSVERASQDIENMLATWMTDNQTDKWSTGVRFVQFMRNRACQPAMKKSPYEAMFGHPAKLGLSSIMPESVIHSINTEEDIGKLEQPNHTQEGVPVPTELPMEVQEFMENNLNLPIDDTDMNLPPDTTEQPCTSGDVPVKTTKQTMSRTASGAQSCDMFCCEISPEKDGYGNKVLCNIHHMDPDMATEKALERQANKMLKLSNGKHPSVEEGVTVRIKVPEVDRGETGARSVLAVVLTKTDNGLYKLGTKKGVLKQLYKKSEFSVCKEKLLSIKNVPAVGITLKQAAMKQPVGSGQGVRNCDCKSKGTTNGCACRKKKLSCNSMGHSVTVEASTPSMCVLPS